MLMPLFKCSIVLILMLMSSIAGIGIDFMMSTRLITPIDCRDDSINRTIPVDIQSRYQPFRLIDLLNGSVKIDFDHIPTDHVLLTFANDQTNKNADVNEIECWSSIVNNSMIVSKSFGSGETQMFCLMEKEAKTVSPLDCLSILPKNVALSDDEDPIWLSEDDKALAIGLLVMGLILCMILGVVIGIVIVKRQVNAKKRNGLSRPDLIGSDWNSDRRSKVVSYPYTDTDAMSVASDRSSNYVAAVNPSRFDLIKIQLEKSENPVPYESQNQYDLEDMPSAKAPTVPEGFRDSGISTNEPVYAISAKLKDRNDQYDNNAENLYLCVEQIDEIDDINKKNE